MLYLCPGPLFQVKQSCNDLAAVFIIRYHFGSVPIKVGSKLHFKNLETFGDGL